MSTATLQNIVFSLPLAERINLADRLYASVPEDFQTDADQAWLDEVERRSAEMDADSTCAGSFDDMIARIRSKRVGA